LEQSLPYGILKTRITEYSKQKKIRTGFGSHSVSLRIGCESRQEAAGRGRGSGGAKGLPAIWPGPWRSPTGSLCSSAPPQLGRRRPAGP